MHVKLTSHLLLIVAIVLGLFVSNTLAQSPPKKRSKLKDFGSSLKRLKWDPIKNATVETKRPTGSTTNSEEDDVVRIETNLVSCDILVVDRQGNVVSGLTAKDFAITDEGESQEVGHFHLGDNTSIPRTIVLIIDYSASQYPYLRNSIDAAKLMVDKLTPRDRMAIVTDDVELLVDFTDDKKKLKEKLESLVSRVKDNGFLGFGQGRRFGKSAQYSALMATLNEAFLEEDLRPIVVFQTDGDEIYNLRNPIVGPVIAPDLPEDLKVQAMENAQRILQSLQQGAREFSLRDIYRAAEKSRATIYTVVPGFQLITRTPEERVALRKRTVEMRINQTLSIVSKNLRAKVKEENARWRVLSPANLAFGAQEAVKVQTALAAVAPRTGGWTEFLETPEQAEGIYNRIFADINQRYIIGYYPTNKEHDGKRRKIKFEVRGRPDYYIVGRNYYYAPSVR